MGQLASVVRATARNRHGFWDKSLAAGGGSSVAGGWEDVMGHQEVALLLGAIDPDGAKPDGAVCYLLRDTSITLESEWKSMDCSMLFR